MNTETNYTDFNIDDTTYQTQLTKKYLQKKKYVPKDPSLLVTLIPGVVKNIFVKTGATVKKGDKLMILEAMKMLNNIQAPYDAVVESIFIEEGQQVPKDTQLIKFKI